MSKFRTAGSGKHAMNTSPPSRSGVPIRSCLYECRVMHHRLSPRVHRFTYGLFLVCLDLDELPAIAGRLRLFSRNRRNLYEFRDRDHLEFPRPGPVSDVAASIRGWIQSQGVTVPDDARISLVTLPRVAGYVFNPVSFYFVRTSAGEAVCAVAEVGNTFGELKPYLIPPAGPSPGNEGGPVRFRCVVPKAYYVSPFSPLDLQFDFNLRAPDERLNLHINDVTGDGGTLLVSTLTGRRHPLTDGQLLRLTARYPLVTLRVITLIHWQALRLWLKRVPWYRKEAEPEHQKGVYRPHASPPTLIIEPGAVRPSAAPNP